MNIKGSGMLGIYVFLGGGVGSVLRYLFTINISRVVGTNFPYGTLAVNVIGSFAMGALVGYLAKTMPHSMELRAFLAVGVLGGFTTFSAFSMDAITLFEHNELSLALLYVIGSVVFSIFAVFFGLAVVRILFN
jgi:fluoride exporter